MNLQDVTIDAFLDELEKMGASKERLTVPQTRSGRRSMHVSTLLKKDNDGTLFKQSGGLSADGKEPSAVVREHDGRDSTQVGPLTNATSTGDLR